MRSDQCDQGAIYSHRIFIFFAFVNFFNHQFFIRMGYKGSCQFFDTFPRRKETDVDFFPVISFKVLVFF